jgi:hypothetical protein
MTPFASALVTAFFLAFVSATIWWIRLLKVHELEFARAYARIDRRRVPR